MSVLPRLAAGVAAALAALLASPPAAAQTADPSPPLVLPGSESSDDIVVSALRIPREKLPTAVYWSDTTIVLLQSMRERSDLFMRCATHITNKDWLREVLDGEPSGVRLRVAQQRIGERAQGCYPPERTVGPVFSNNAVTIADTATTVELIDRGVIVEEVLRRYAPDAALTVADMRDPSVRSRFEGREGFRNRLRLANDRGALVLSACLVREQPVLATRLLRSTPASELEKGLTQAMLIEARSCLNDARRVTIDPTLIRAYVADAFYRWVVAARGVDSLLPVAG